MTSDIQGSIRAEAAAEQKRMEEMAHQYAARDVKKKSLEIRLRLLRDALQPYMDLNDLTEVIDGETGMGVRLDPPQSTTEWDTRNLSDAEALFLRNNGLLNINTTAFNAARKSAGSIELDDIYNRLRIEGVKNAAFRAVQGD